MIQLGDIGFSHRKKKGYSSIVGFVTGSFWTHTFVVLDKFYGDFALIEADYKVQVVSFEQEYINKTEDYWEIWRPNALLGEKIRETERIYKKYAGKTYGFLQIPWFIWKRVAKFIGISPGKNWFPNGAICSEVNCDYSQGLNEKMRESLPFTLNEVDPDDLYDVVKSRPDLFTFVCSNKK